MSVSFSFILKVTGMTCVQTKDDFIQDLEAKLASSQSAAVEQLAAGRQEFAEQIQTQKREAAEQLLSRMLAASLLALQLPRAKVR